MTCKKLVNKSFPWKIKDVLEKFHTGSFKILECKYYRNLIVESDKIYPVLLFTKTRFIPARLKLQEKVDINERFHIMLVKKIAGDQLWLMRKPFQHHIVFTTSRLILFSWQIFIKISPHSELSMRWSTILVKNEIFFFICNKLIH